MIVLYIINILSLRREYYNKYRKYININKLNYSLKTIVKLLDILYNKYEYNSVQVEDINLQLDVEYPSLSQEKAEDIYQNLETLKTLQNKEVSTEHINDVLRRYIDRHYANELIEGLLPLLEENVQPEAKYKLSELYDEWSDVSEELTNRDKHVVTDSLEDIFEIENDDSGYEWFCDELTDSLGRIKQGDLGLIFAAPNSGKEQPHYSLIYTPEGWVTMGDIKIGDVVYDDEGNKQTVLDKYPQGMKDIYRVYLADGSYADCGLEHLWRVAESKDRHKTERVMPLKDMIKAGCKEKDGRSSFSVGYYSPQIKNESPLMYALGVFLGDGSYSVNMRLHNTERDIIESFINITLGEEGYKHNSSTNIKKAYLFKEMLTDLGLRYKRSYEKALDWDYIYRLSSGERLSLLRGMMDTDGYVNVDGQTLEFTSSSKNLAEIATYLVRSLGGYASIKAKNKTGYKKDGKFVECRQAFRVYIKFSNDVVPVSSKKHLSKYKPTNKRKRRYIKKIEKLPYKYKCSCIRVSGERSMYVTDSFIPTHNTAFALSIITNLIKQSCKVLHINNEERGTKVKLRFMENYFCKTKSELFFDKEYFYKKYLDECSEHYILYNTGDMHVSELKNLIKEYEPEVIVIDQAWKLRVRKEDRQDMTLQAIWNSLRNIVKEYQVHIIGTQQSDSTGYDNKKLYLSMEAIHGSKIGVQGELDYAIGINSNTEDFNNPQYRYISTPKNKNTGKEDTRLILNLDKDRSRYDNNV